MRAAVIGLVVGSVTTLGTVMASEVQAEPIKTFADICIATDGSRTLATAAALESGWSIAPAEVQAAFSVGPAGQVNVYATDAFNEFLLIGVAAERVELDASTTAEVGYCAVAGLLDQLAVFQNLQTAIGISPVTTRGETMFLYSRDQGRIVSESGTADLPASEFLNAIRQRQIQMIQVQQGATATVLGLIPIRP